MYPAKYFIGKPIICIKSGRDLGTVKDVYFDMDLQAIIGLYLGQEDLFSHKALLIRQTDVVTFGPDAIIVRDSTVVIDSSQVSDISQWLRRDRLQGRQIATPERMLVGAIDDAVVNEESQVIGFTLSRVFVKKDPITGDRAVSRKVIIDVGDEDIAMSIDLVKAHRQRFRVKHLLKSLQSG